MRAEEKELEGPDLEREQSREDMREAASIEEELPELTVDVKDVELDHRSRLFDALRLVLAGEQVNLTLLYLPQRETRALEALQAAVNGNDSMGEFVFAEDRKSLLEQALAVLQQNLTHGEPEQLAELQSKFDSMTEQVGELRERLTNLEDAQEELDEWHNAAREKGDDADKDDDEKPTPKADAGLVDFIAEALYAMADVQQSKSATLAGEERPQPTQPSSLMHGPDKKDPPRPASSLAGPEPTEAPKPPSSLTGGTAIDIAPKPRSTLYDDGPPSAGDERATLTHDPSPQRRKILPTPEREPPPKKGTS